MEWLREGDARVKTLGGAGLAGRLRGTSDARERKDISSCSWKAWILTCSPRTAPPIAKKFSDRFSWARRGRGHGAIEVQRAEDRVHPAPGGRGKRGSRRCAGRRGSLRRRNYRWRKTYGGLMPSAMKRLKQLEGRRTSGSSGWWRT